MRMVYVFRWWTKFCFKYNWVSVKNVCRFHLLFCNIRSVDTRLTKIIYNCINPNETAQKRVVINEIVFMASSKILFHLSQGYKIFNSRFTFKPLINNNQQFLICILRPFKGCFCVLQHLLNQDVFHCFDVLVTIISTMTSFVTTRVGDIVRPSGAKIDTGVTVAAVVLVVSKDTNLCFRPGLVDTNYVESFLVTVGLQRGPRANELLPRVTAQWSSSVFAICDQWIQGSGLMVDDNRLELLTDLHSKTDLVKRCVPISR